MEEISDQQLFRLMDALDRKLFSDDLEGDNRRSKLRQATHKELNINNSTYTSTLGGIRETELSFEDQNIWQKIETLSNLFVQKTEQPIIYRGATSFQDQLYFVDWPAIFGTVVLNEKDFFPSEVWEVLQGRLHKEEAKQFQQGFKDAVCIGSTLAGVNGFPALQDGWGDYFRMAASHCQAAFWLVSSTSDFRGSVYQNLLAVELTAKSALRFKGVGEGEISSKKYGHNLSNIVSRLKQEGLVQFAKVLEAETLEFPEFVKSRYEMKTASRKRAVQIAMSSQRVLGEWQKSI